MAGRPPKRGRSEGGGDDRRAREAAALRANLRRRKEQARGRRSAVEAAPELPPSGTNEDAQGGEDGAD
ncbi:MAG: hypothetical protein RLO50_14560 [Azospirillaceae bacterium]